MNRRSLFKRLGAVAAAVAVAPVVDVSSVEAAPETSREFVFSPDTDTSIVVNTHSYMAWQMEPLTFDDLRAGCEAGGCHLEHQYSIERLRHEYAHWRDGDVWADDTLTTQGRDLEPVAAWLDGLHERMARAMADELAVADDYLATPARNTFPMQVSGTSTFTLRGYVDTAWEVDVINPGGRA